MEGYRHHIPIGVRFRDVDAMGHVNNAVFFTYLETARVEYIRAVGFFLPARVDGLPRGLDGSNPFRDQSGKGLILAQIMCQFKKPIFYGQSVQVGTRVVEVGNSSFRVEQCVEADGQLSALAEAIVVHYDYEAGKSVPIPDGIRARIATFEHGAHPT
jgi:acyl-CoA thioester hydrolase